jgi:predicted nuclease with TOPRIM domain
MPTWITSVVSFVSGLLKRPIEPKPAEGWSTLVRSLQKNLKDAVARIDELQDEVTDLVRKLAKCEAHHEAAEVRLKAMEEHLNRLQNKLGL